MTTKIDRIARHIKPFLKDMEADAAFVNMDGNVVYVFVDEIYIYRCGLAVAAEDDARCEDLDYEIKFHAHQGRGVMEEYGLGFLVKIFP